MSEPNETSHGANRQTSPRRKWTQPPGSEANICGFSDVQLLLVDEAARVAHDLYLAKLPSLAHSNGELWLMSTPWGRLGFFFKTWTKPNDLDPFFCTALASSTDSGGFLVTNAPELLHGVL